MTRLHVLTSCVTVALFASSCVDTPTESGNDNIEANEPNQGAPEDQDDSQSGSGNATGDGSSAGDGDVAGDGDSAGDGDRAGDGDGDAAGDGDGGFGGAPTSTGGGTQQPPPCEVGCGDHSCEELEACLLGCNDGTCACLELASPEAVVQSEALRQCADENECARDDLSCAPHHCREAYGACYPGSLTGTTCREAWDCYSSCSHIGCAIACIDAMQPIYSLAEYSLRLCANEAGCRDFECLSEACPEPLERCE